MARNFTIPWQGGKVDRPASAFAQQDEVPTTLHPCDAFAGGAADESVDLRGIVPAEYTGSGTLKLGILVCSSTTNATHTARFDAFTEFKTAGAGEALNSSGLDATPDSGDVDFSTTAYEYKRLTITLTPATTPAVGDAFRIRVTRDQDHANDDMTDIDALVVGYELYEET